MSREYRFVPVQFCAMCGSTRHRLKGLRLNGSQGRRPRRASGIAVSVKRCLDCDLVFADPLPIPARLSDHYGLPPEEYWPPEDFVLDPSYLGREIQEAKRLLGFRPGMAALDIGAGLGKGMTALSRAGFDTYGIEPSEPFHARAMEAGADPSRLANATLQEAQFPPGMFDFITFGAVLEHLFDPAAAIERALQWLKPGGIVHVEVPSSKHLISRIINAYYRLLGTNYVTNLSPMHPPFHLFEFGLRSFEKHGARAGYVIASHRIEVCSIYHVPALFHGPLRWLMKQSGTGMQLTVYLKRADCAKLAE